MFTTRSCTRRATIAFALAGSTALAFGAGPVADTAFAQTAALGGMAEVELGRRAQQQGSTDKVRRFGAQMVRDHADVNKELASIATAKGMTLPTSLDERRRGIQQQLAEKSGAAFDADFRNTMVGNHRQTIALFEQQAMTGEDAELEAFAARTLPALRKHLEMAQAL